MLRRVWADPVWSKVIAGVILAAGAALSTYLLDWWPDIGRGVRRGYEFAQVATPIPNWLIGLLALMSLPVVLLVGLAVWIRLFPAKEAGPNWRSYTSDNFFGLLWRWRYLDDGQIYDICTFCPRCDYLIHPEDVSAYRAVDRIGFRCDSCGSQLGEFDESAHSLENKVKRFVQQKLRNGTWVVPNRATPQSGA